MKRTALLAAAALSCSSTTFDPASKVESVRVLAVSADRPYVAPGDRVTLDVLAYDGRRSPPSPSVPMTLSWLPVPCVDPPGDAYFACFPAFARAFQPGVDLTSRLVQGATFAFDMPADAITAHAPAGGASYGLAVAFAIACAGHVEYVTPAATDGPDAVPFGCFDDAHVRLGADAFVFAYSLVYAFADRTNENPVIEGLTLDGAAVDPTAGITLDRCTTKNDSDCPTKKIDTTVPAASWEPDPGDLDLNGHVLNEEIYVDYYLTGGAVHNDVTVLYDPRSGRLPATGDALSAPRGAGDYLLWAVVHDNRGGVAWQEVPLHAR